MCIFTIPKQILSKNIFCGFNESHQVDHVKIFNGQNSRNTCFLFFLSGVSVFLYKNTIDMCIELNCLQNHNHIFLHIQLQYIRIYITNKIKPDFELVSNSL